jgi:hypothetical protein
LFKQLRSSVAYDFKCRLELEHWLESRCCCHGRPAFRIRPGGQYRFYRRGVEPLPSAVASFSAFHSRSCGVEYDHRASLAGIRGDKQGIESDEGNRLINILPRKRIRSKVYLIVAFLAVQTVSAQERSPAVPLVVHNPYFSIWSMADRLTGEPTRHWTGAPQPIEGIARIDGKAYRFMGKHPDTLPAMDQTSNTITPTQTQYEFREGGVQLRLEFFTPAIMSNLDVLSRPVAYHPASQIHQLLPGNIAASLETRSSQAA